MWIKNILLQIFIIILISNNTVHGEINNSIENQSINVNSSLATISMNVNQVDLNAQLRDIELEKEFLAGKKNSYDSFLNTVLIILTLFGFLLTLVVVLSGFLFYKNANELKEDVKKDINDFKTDVRNELKTDFSEKAQVIIKETMKSTYEKPILELTDRFNLLDNSVTDLKTAYGKKQRKLPEYLEEKEMANKEPQIENIFEDQ